MNPVKEVLRLPFEITSLRREYTLRTFDEDNASVDPFTQFERWFKEATETELTEPNAMVLATVDKKGRPRTRVVLLKAFDQDGFTFFTNYDSTKGCHLSANPHAAINFHWPELERQVCMEGSVEKVSNEDSVKYFRTRPRNSQIGAWVSQQSAVITGRTVLEESWKKREQEFANKEVPLPPHWGGYRLIPDRVEFWQGRSSRLHDRIQYTHQSPGSWSRERLAP